MLILAIDSSGKQGSIALARGDAGSFELIAEAPIAGGTFSAQMIPQISALLEQHHLKKEQIEGFAVATGPGSFTGLRIGLTAIKALAEVLQKPIAAVSVLEAIAYAAAVQGCVVALLDAQRNEIYVGEYTINHTSTSKRIEYLVRREELTTTSWQGGTVVTANEALANIPGITAKIVPWPGSQSVARLGLQKILAGDTVSVEALDANYIRRTDAEIFSQPK